MVTSEMVDSIIINRNFILIGKFPGETFPVRVPFKKGNRVSFASSIDTTFVQIEGEANNPNTWGEKINPELFGLTHLQLFNLIKRENLPFFKRLFY